MAMKKLSILFIILSIYSFTYGQQELLLLSGKRIIVKDTKIDSSGVILYKTMKGKVKGFEQEEVFSLTREDKVEVIFYKPDCKDVCFKITQMRDYINGLADGREQKCGIYMIGGAVIGLTSGVLVPSFLSPVAPALTSVGVGIFKPKTEKLKIPEKYNENAHYIEGFQKSVRKKRVTNSIIGGGIGLVVGLSVAAILQN